MVVLLKYASRKMFDKICLKAIDVIRGQRDSIFCWGWYPAEGKSLNFFGLQGDSQIPSLTGTSRSLPNETSDEGASSAYCNIFEKSD